MGGKQVRGSSMPLFEAPSSCERRGSRCVTRVTPKPKHGTKPASTCMHTRGSRCAVLGCSRWELISSFVFSGSAKLLLSQACRF
jgi:hypothetical protein